MHSTILKTTQFGLAIAALTLIPSAVAAQQTETDIERRMAQRMAERMDTVWDQEPEDGMANIRFLITRGDVPFSGKVSIYTEFSFRAVQHGGQSTQGFNPNENGRWVYEDLEPGQYELHVVGSERFEGFTWTEHVTVAAGDKPIFEIAVP